MKIRKEGSESNPRFKMMENAITIKQIEKWFGKETANALIQYCKLKKKTIEKVADDDREWDRFEMWSKSKQRKLGTNSDKFSNWQKAAKIDDDVRGARTYDNPSDADIYGEGGGSRMDEWEISSWIADEINDCEWARDVHFRNDNYEDPWFDFFTIDGDRFKVTVSKMM